MTLLSFHSLTLGLLFNGLAKAYLHKDTQLVAHRELSSNTCNANTPCVSGVCCSTSGSCGYGPAFCGAGNCLSNCDAKPECGQYAAPGSEACPLNICCSKYGSCGTSQDFCGEGCQSNCAPPTKPTCDASFTASQRIVGYYESWAHGRPCQTVAPEDLNATGFTHINYGFLLFDPSTFAIAPADEGAMPLATRFTDLKTSNPGLKTWVSVGGWSFNDPGPTLTAFSDMVGSPANRTNFITELMHFMDAYAFDGVDLDWEYPVASDRGGKPADKENYVFFCNELRIALGPKYGLSVTLPMSPFYLRNFDVERLQSSVDWFNVMSYDMHGVWDKNQGEAFIRPHSNITEIDEGLDVFWRAKVAPSKVNLGLAWYGRSFALESSNCSTPDGACKFTGAGSSGPCSNVPGTLNLAEIQDLVAQQKVKPSFDKLAGVKWMTYNTSQWVSYDDAETVKLKQAYANSRCLGGTMVWAMDQVYQKSACELAPARRPTVSTSLSSSAGNGSTTSCLGQMISTSVSPTRRALTSLGRTTFSRHSNATSACSALSQKHGVSTSTLQVLSGNLACTFTNSACLPKPCTLSYLHTNTTCTALGASLKNVTEAQLKTWNPALVSGDCANVQSGQHVCISPPGGWYTCARPPGLAGSGGSGSSSSGAATGTESAGAAMKTQPGIASNCNAYATVTSGDTCLALASAHGISPNDLYAWNAVLGKDEAACATALWSGESYCVGTGAIAGSNSSTAATFQPPFANTTASSSAVLASSTGHVTAYTTKTVYHTTTLFAFDSSRSSTSTTSSTSAVFTYDQTTSPFSYNPTTLLTTPSSSSPRPPPTASTSTSPVSIDSHTLTTNPVPSSSSASPPPQPTAPSSPSLLRPGTAASCAKFAQAQPLDTCLNFAATYGISPEEFYSWNPVLGEGGEDCAVGLWAGFYYCVGLVSE